MLYLHHFHNHVNDVSCIGHEIETDEMLPQWFDVNNMPKYEDMCTGIKYWHKLWLQGKRFEGYCLSDETGVNVLKHDFKEI